MNDSIPELTKASLVTASSRIAARVVDGHAVVIVIDEQALHTLNAVGTVVWTELERGERRIADLVEKVTREFDVEEARATEDVLAFVGELRGLGALEIRS